MGEGPGAPLLVSHGGPGFSHDYLLALDDLAATRPVIFYDQLESARSDKPNDPSLWTLPRFVAELHALREGLALDRFFHLGHSWGGALAVAFAVARPAGLLGTIVASPLLSARDWVADNKVLLEGLPDSDRAAIEAHERAGTTDAPAYQDAMMAFYRRHLCRAEPWPPEVVRAVEMANLDVYHAMNGPSEWAVVGMLRDLDLTPSLPRIACPALFTCGVFDEAAPATVRRYAALVPGGARVAVFAGASHTPHIEARGAYMAVLADFLAQVEAGALRSRVS